jgi:hypothetical protein
MAILYYQLDDRRNFSSFHRDTRMNMSMMLMVIANPEPLKVVTEEQLKFFNRYAWAWLGNIIWDELSEGEYPQDGFIDLWMNTDLDLIHFNARRTTELVKRMDQLRIWKPELPAEAHELLHGKRKLTLDEFKSVGPKMAMQFLLDWQEFN